MNPNLSEMNRRSLIKVPPMLSLLPTSLNIIEEETCYTKSAKFSKFVPMKIEEAIVYCLATSNRGMRSEQIADMINRQRLHLRKDGQPVSAKQVFYVVTHAPHTFCLAEGRIMLMM